LNRTGISLYKTGKRLIVECTFPIETQNELLGTENESVKY